MDRQAAVLASGYSLVLFVSKLLERFEAEITGAIGSFVAEVFGGQHDIRFGTVAARVGVNLALICV